MNTHTTPQILAVEKIWDRGPHNAFTDLVRFADRWWCTFREAQDHGPSIGTVRVICSDDGFAWKSAAVLAEQVEHEGLLWMSYYSSHEGKTSIYLARIAV